MATLSNEANVNTCLRAHELPNERSGLFTIVHSTSSGPTYRLLRALIMAESSEKDYFDTGKLIIEVENIFWDTHISPHIYYVAGLLAVFGSLKVNTTLSFLALFENKSLVHKLWSSSQNPLSFHIIFVKD